MKVCNINGYCNFRTIGGLFASCKYQEYCDFQAPRDSQNKFFNDRNSCLCEAYRNENCPIHGYKIL